MSDDSTVLCRRCGFANTRGDQFCGSCGSFLEWEGQPLETVATAPGGDIPVTPSVPGSTATPITGSTAPPPTPPPTQPRSGATSSTPPSVSPPSPGPGELVRCPACGIANPVGRTFCQVCGATLAGAAAVREASREEIAEAVATPSRLTTAPVAAGTIRSAGRDAEKGGRRIPGWLLGVAVLGIAAGVGVVVLTQVLRPAAPEGGAGVTQAPGGGVSPAPGSTDAPGQSAAPTDAPGPTDAPAIVELKLKDAEASSVVGNRAKFQPQKAIDGDKDTCWQEGSAEEKDQWIEVTFDGARAETLLISNGHQASSALYKGNRRLRDVLVSVNGLDPIKVRLKDTMKVQRVALGGVSGATSVRITIVNTYAPKRTSVDGTPFDDAAVAEIAVLGVPGR